jgi:uncharacterized protein GlcG (DUF336 family)
MKSKPVVAAVLSAMLSSLPVAAQEETLVSFKVLAPETALELAQATLQACRKKGYQVAVAVVDRMGVPAASFRTNTLSMMEETQAGKPQSGVRFVDEALMIGGGVMVEASGSLVGAVGVSGAPGGELDDACAKAGIAAIEDKLLF